MKHEKLLEAEELMDVARRFAKHSDIAAKRELQKRFMAQHKNAQLLAAIRKTGMPSVMPTNLSFKQHSGQSWPCAQREWLDKNEVK